MLDCLWMRNNFLVLFFSVVGFKNEYIEILGLLFYLSEVSYKVCVGFLFCFLIFSRF